MVDRPHPIGERVSAQAIAALAPRFGFSPSPQGEERPALLERIARESGVQSVRQWAGSEAALERDALPLMFKAAFFGSGRGAADDRIPQAALRAEVEESLDPQGAKAAQSSREVFALGLAAERCDALLDLLVERDPCPGQAPAVLMAAQRAAERERKAKAMQAERDKLLGALMAENFEATMRQLAEMAESAAASGAGAGGGESGAGREKAPPPTRLRSLLCPRERVGLVASRRSTPRSGRLS